MVMVWDNIVFVVFCKSFVKEFDLYGNVSFIFDDLFDEVNSFDNCVINLFFIVFNIFNCFIWGEYIVIL